MRVFKTRFFANFARKSGIEDCDLCQAVKCAEAGLIDADLGGGVIKQRIARKGQGRSGGFRTIVLFRQHDRAVFINGYAKKDKTNMADDDLLYYRKLAKPIMAYSMLELGQAVASGSFIEVQFDDKTIS